MNPPKLGFLTDPVRVSLDALLPTRKIRDETRITRYATILASIKEVGMIEPLNVYPQKGKSGNYFILDGHLRYLALKELGEMEVDCLVSTEDEAFTYNNRISRVCAIQEHRMILKAVQNGVSPERIASALNKSLREVNGMISLLNGIHEDAAELLKDKPIAAQAIYAMKRVVAERQIEMAEIMVSMNITPKVMQRRWCSAHRKNSLRDQTNPK
jgi:ParB-like chromosome segregation protein Spo0J